MDISKPTRLDEKIGRQTNKHEMSLLHGGVAEGVPQMRVRCPGWLACFAGVGECVGRV